MSVLSVEEVWSGGRPGRDGIERIREYTRRFEVITDNASDDVTVAGGPEAAALGMPRNGDPYPNDPDAVMIDIAGRCSEESPYIWEFDCSYSSKIPDDLAKESQTFDELNGDSVPTDTAPGDAQAAASAQRDPDPVNWTPVWKITHEQTTEPLTHDYLGNLICNSAGDPFYPPLSIERSYAVFTVTKNYGSVKFDYLETYVDSVNLNTWKGRAARTCRMIAFEYEPVVTNNYSYWRVTYRIKYKPGSWDGNADNDVGQGWDKRILDAGFRTRSGTDPDYAHADITDLKTGEKPEKPVLLNGSGGVHPSFLAATTSDPKRFVTWEVYKRRDWAGLGL